MLLSQIKQQRGFFSTGYAPVKKTFCAGFKKRRSYYGTDKEQRGRASAGPEDPAAVGPLYGKDERNTVGADSSAAEYQPES